MGFHLRPATLVRMEPGSVLLAHNAALPLTKQENGFWMAEGQDTKYSCRVLSYWRIAWTLEPLGVLS